VPDARRGRLLAVATAALFLSAGCSAATPPQQLRIGAMFPLAGSAAALAGDEYRGAEIAAQLVNAAGGVDGKQIALDLRDVESAAQVSSAAAGLAADGVPAVIGAYSSELSIPASAAVAHRGLVYWETGAVADQLTAKGLPMVFRVGADGADLGGNSARFLVDQIGPRLHAAPAALHVFLVTADDAYAHSVADAARAGLVDRGAVIAGEGVYNPYAPNWRPVLDAIAAARPNILVLSSHIPDGIAFRRAFIASGLHVQAFLGTTMAQCLPDFGYTLGADAVGVFASDRPPNGFNAGALDGAALSLYHRFAGVWQQQTGRAPSEEGIAGFSAAWVLFNNALPHAASLQPKDIAAAARSLDLPEGSLPNGAGVRFSSDASQLGQNTRAAAVIWQWQAVDDWYVVWPPVYATSTIKLVPLP
jgi:branched-chain amino acid transport system substrate-binding protein